MENQNTKDSEPLLHIPDEEERRVGGFLFDDYRDAKEALREQNNIERLKEKINFDQPEELSALYDRLVKEQVFKTPIGLQFLGEFREYLVDEMNIPQQEVPLIYVLPSNGMPRGKQEQLELLTKENQRLEIARRKYLISVIALALVIAIMFAITVLNPNVGYINTENKILNRYAAWEEDLTRREAELRAREAELGGQADTEALTEENSE